MKNGYTTGSCATAAAKAAAIMLLGNTYIENISIVTPAGIIYEAELEDIRRERSVVSCAVRKYSGDDPDITSGALIYATVSIASGDDKGVIIEGGTGVGRVTRPGLDQPVGNAAINSVPRKMITAAVEEVKNMYGCQNDIQVVISVPDGEGLAAKTFNPKLGIEGGISIIGTSGIVEPMSTRAILDTIRVSLNQKKAEGHMIAVVAPGNYGLEYMRQEYGYDLEQAVKCSNYIGDTIDMVKELGFSRMLLVGHMGKLIKVSGGIMNTHSKEADCRMELMAVAAMKAGADSSVINSILGSLTTEEAYDHVEAVSLTDSVGDYLMERIDYYLNRRAGEGLKVECIMYTEKHGKTGCTSGAERLIAEAMSEEV